jgi:hypothetical protein
MLESLWNLFAGIVTSLWGLLASVVGFVCDLAVWVHVETPRLEGLMVGVLLAWLLARRDSHPVLRVLSAPLKLVLDILDLAWDQGTEVLSDVWGTAKGWTLGSLGWVTSKARGAYDSLMAKLRSTKETIGKED